MIRGYTMPGQTCCTCIYIYIYIYIWTGHCEHPQTIIDRSNISKIGKIIRVKIQLLFNYDLRCVRVGNISTLLTITKCPTIRQIYQQPPKRDGIVRINVNGV